MIQGKAQPGTPSHTNIPREGQVFHSQDHPSRQQTQQAAWPKRAKPASPASPSQILSQGGHRVPVPHSPCPASPGPPGPPPCPPGRRSARESHSHFSGWDHLWGGGQAEAQNRVPEGLPSKSPASTYHSLPKNI